MIPFVRSAPPPYGAVEEFGPDLRRVTAPNPGPFTYHGTGTYIVGRGEVAVIDPGPRIESHLKALVSALAGDRVRLILTTHSHMDHSPLARPLQATVGGEIVGRSDPRAGRGLEEANEEDFRPDREVADGERMAGPGWTLEALATPGHASNHVAYAFLERNLLFSGDHVMGWSTTVVSPPDGDMSDYFDSLDRVAARRFAALHPTHGPPVTDVAPFLAAYREHRLARERQVLQAVEDGCGRIADMVTRLYADVDPRLHPAAARSVEAHLLRLVRRKRVAATGDDPAAAIYTAIR